MIVLKFGGTSVSTKERIRTICEIVARNENRQPIVVVSAIRGVTDLLLSCVDTSQQKRRKIIKEIEEIHLRLVRSYWRDDVSSILVYLAQSLREIESLLRKRKKDKALFDHIVSYGERLSAFVISKALESSGMAARAVVATDLIVTDDHFTSAEFLPSETKRRVKKILRPLLRRTIVPVVTGFIGATRNGKTTTLGRGGSDYSASILGFALDVDEIQIWTDVDGMYSADPRVVSSAHRLPEVSYREASELAAFGAKVLHPRTIRPAIAAGIPVRILNTLNRESNGTLIVAPNGKRRQRIAAIASKKNVTLVNLYSTDMLYSKGFLVRIFSIFSKCGISVDLVSVSEVSVSVTLDNAEQLEKAIDELSTFTSVTKKEASVVSLVGERIVDIPCLMQDVFTTLEDINISVQMVSLGASDINISVVIDSHKTEQAVSLLHERLIASRYLAQRRYL